MSRITVKPKPDPVAVETLDAIPEDCTCAWASTETFGGVYVSMGKDCPVWPHPKRWSKPEGER